MTESPSALLERAAIHLAALSNDATPGPWRDLPMGSDGSVVLAGGNTISTARRPARCGEFADATWIATVNPAVARPLFTWLKSEAMALDRYGVVAGEPEGRLPEHTQAALEFARLVLGEELDRG